MRKQHGFLLIGILCMVILCACTEQSKQEVTSSVKEYLEEQAGNISDKIQESFSEAANNVKDGAEGFAEEIKDNLADNVKDAIDGVKDNISNNVTNAIDEVKENITDDVKDALDEVKDNVTDGAKDAIDDVKDTTEYVKYRFRNYKLLDQHYDKHGKEMGFANREEYEKAASDVINNPKALHKREAEDNDFVYYVEETNEFVILSEDGYIRTYFLPSGGKKYYDRQ